MSAIKIFTSSIRFDESIQSRAEIDEEVVADYAEALANGVAFPPVVVFHDGVEHWLADGFHRFHAHIRAKRESILAEIRNGDRRAALLHSCGANADHGLRRTNADKRKAVEILLADEEWGKWSDREIGRACKVAHSFVGKVRNDLDSKPGGASERKFQRKGTTATMDTARINARRSMSDAERERKAAAEQAQREHDEAYESTPEEIQRMHLDTVDENEELRAQVAQLSASDLGAEVRKERELRKIAEQQAGEAMDEARRFQRELKKFGNWFGELRKLTHCSSNGEAMKVIRRELAPSGRIAQSSRSHSSRQLSNVHEECANEEPSDTPAYTARLPSAAEKRNDQERELRDLVDFVLVDASLEERDEAFETGRRDLDAALESFRGLARDKAASGNQMCVSDPEAA